MRQKHRDAAISARYIKFGFAAALCCTLISGGNSTAAADGFQRIRTFDPNKGLVAGNGSSGNAAGQSYAAPTSWSTQQSSGQSSAYSGANTVNSSMVTQNYTSQSGAGNATSGDGDESDDSRGAKHHKHHHKFLMFGHEGGEGKSADNNSQSNQPNSRVSSERAPDFQQNNKLYIPINPSYVPDPVSTVVSPPVSMPPAAASRMPSLVAPPDPRQRPSAPNIDQNARLPFVQNSGAKPSLAWRARAWKLASEPDDTSSTSRHPARILNCSIDEAIGAAANCCRAKGAQIVGQSIPAGQLGVRFTDNANNRSFIIFVAKSVGNNRTLLKASADSDRGQKVALANDLVQQVGVIIDGKGLL